MKKQAKNKFQFTFCNLHNRSFNFLKRIKTHYRFCTAKKSKILENSKLSGYEKDYDLDNCSYYRYDCISSKGPV